MVIRDFAASQANHTGFMIGGVKKQCTLQEIFVAGAQRHFSGPGLAVSIGVSSCAITCMTREKTQYFQFCIVHAAVCWSKSSCNLSRHNITVDFLVNIALLLLFWYLQWVGKQDGDTC